MAQYLHIRVEDIDLLLPALQVHEVIGFESTDPPPDAHALWRDQVLSACDLGQLLKRCEKSLSRNYGVVYSLDHTNSPPVLMVIDEVLGLRHPTREQLHRLPGAPTSAHQLFDALWIDHRKGFKAYCLKTQLPPNFLSPVGTEQEGL